MNMSLSEEETMEIWFSRVVDGNDAILKHLPLNKQKCTHKHLHDELNYKYLIAIDGWAAGWLRAPLILLSNSVPIIVESNYTPLH